MTGSCRGGTAHAKPAEIVCAFLYWSQVRTTKTHAAWPQPAEL